MVPSLLLQSCESPMSAEKNPGRKIKLRKSKFQIRKLKFPKSSFISRIYFINFSTNRKKLSSVKAHLSQRNEIYKIVFQYFFLFKVRNISTPTRQKVQPRNPLQFLYHRVIQNWRTKLLEKMFNHKFLI